MNRSSWLRHVGRYRAAYVLCAGLLVMVLVAPTEPVHRTSSSLAIEPTAGGDGVPPETRAPEIAAPAEEPSAAPREVATTAPSSTTSTIRPPDQSRAKVPSSGGARGNAASAAPPSRNPERGAAPAAPAAAGTAPTTGDPGSTPTAPTGKPQLTRTGAACGPGTRQFESAYAPPCRSVWGDPNGGATYRGVTAGTIKIVSRRYGDGPDNLVAKQILAQAGQAPEDSTAAVRQVFLDYFNKTYELYGRRVVLSDYTTNASP